jgi:hypothetical protein
VIAVNRVTALGAQLCIRSVICHSNMVNVDRLLHAEVGDAALDQSKVEVLSRSLRPSATAERSQIIPSDRSVVKPQGFAIALDCDVLFSCVGRPRPRAALKTSSRAADAASIVSRCPCDRRK